MPTPPLHFAYDTDGVGVVRIIGADGAPCRAAVSTSRPDDPRGPVVELLYDLPGVRGFSRALYAADIAAIANNINDTTWTDDEFALAKMAIDMLEGPHPLAGVRDAARARKFANEVLNEIV